MGISKHTHVCYKRAILLRVFLFNYFWRFNEHCGPVRVSDVVVENPELFRENSVKSPIVDDGAVLFYGSADLQSYWCKEVSWHYSGGTTYYSSRSVLLYAVVFSFVVAHTVAVLRRGTYVIVVATKLSNASVCVHMKIKLRALQSPRITLGGDVNQLRTAEFDKQRLVNDYNTLWR